MPYNPNGERKEEFVQLNDPRNIMANQITIWSREQEAMLVFRHVKPLFDPNGQQIAREVSDETRVFVTKEFLEEIYNNLDTHFKKIGKI